MQNYFLALVVADERKHEAYYNGFFGIYEKIN